MNQDSTFVPPPDGSAPHQPRTARGKATRARLLEAAEQEFGSLGYHAASVAGITRRAGAAMGTFYVYFASKEALYRDLVAHMGELTRDHIARRIEGAPDRLEAERLGLLAYLEFTRAHPGFYRIVLEAQFVAEDAFRDYYRVFASGYRTALSTAAARGEICEGDDEVRAWALMGLSSWLGMRYGVWDESVPAEDVASAAFALISKGLSPI
jgi:AcrR family transcriptional regulator